jgi:hypothetical protein
MGGFPDCANAGRAPKEIPSISTRIGRFMVLSSLLEFPVNYLPHVTDACRTPGVFLPDFVTLEKAVSRQP